MKLACNIDQRGRWLRLLAGIVVDTAGLILIVIGGVRDLPALLAAGIVAGLAGSFMIFEGAVGWCALRALGFKTKL